MEARPGRTPCRRGVRGGLRTDAAHRLSSDQAPAEPIHLEGGACPDHSRNGAGTRRRGLRHRRRQCGSTPCLPPVPSSPLARPVGGPSAARRTRVRGASHPETAPRARPTLVCGRRVVPGPLHDRPSCIQPQSYRRHALATVLSTSSPTCRRRRSMTTPCPQSTGVHFAKSQGSPRASWRRLPGTSRRTCAARVRAQTFPLLSQGSACTFP